MAVLSVYQQLMESAQQYAERPFLHIPASALSADSGMVEPILQPFDASYAEMLEVTNELRAQYQGIELKIGDRVALLLQNKPEFFQHWFALNSLGVCVVPVNSELMVDEVSYLLKHSDVCLAVGFQHKLPLLQNAAAGAELELQIVADTKIDTARFPAREDEESEKVSLQTECAILYTSGSTGKPKGCLLSNEYFLSSGAWYRDAQGYCKLENGLERLATPLPLVHMNAMAVSTMGMMMTGGCLIQLDRFHPKTWRKTIRETEATVIHYLGVMPAILLNMPVEDGDDFSGQVKFGFGAGVNPVHHAPFEKRFGFPLIESWGMTETGCSNCITAIVEPRHVGTSCIGKQPPGLDIKLVDESGYKVEPGAPGELLVRAKGNDPRKGFFSGYYKNQLATDEAWREGWLHTGDILRQSEDGSFHFVDRLKNVIRRSGENISALEVEATMSLNPQIDQVAVTAVPDEIRGDEVIACVILSGGSKDGLQTAQQIQEHARKSLAYYKLPGYIVFLESLPLTASNKPQRAELKKLAREIVANIDSHSGCFDLRALKKK